MHHVKWVPYHHGIACPHIADGGQGFQIWRIPANILNKQSRTADSWLSSLGIGRRANPHYITSDLLRNVQQSPGPGQILWHDLSTRNWVGKAYGMHVRNGKSVQGLVGSPKGRHHFEDHSVDGIRMDLSERGWGRCLELIHLVPDGGQ
jgi:hypothetical protein